MNRTQEDKFINYHFPNLGEVNIHLKGNSLGFFNLLEEQGEIKRLKGLKHIGNLNVLFPGIEHTRYDYMLLNLYLAQRLNFSNHPDKPVDDIKISKQEFLELLVLASNIGHIYGTFATEKAILKFLLENKKLLREILKPIKSLKNIKYHRIEQWVITQQDYTMFNKVLALIKVATWFSNLKDDDSMIVLLKSVAEIIMNLILEEERKEYQNDIYEKYNILRRISYLFLDSSYIQTPIKIDFVKLFQDDNLKKIIKESEAKKIIFQYEKIVYDDLYHSKEARILTALTTKEIPEILKKKNNPVQTIDGWQKKFRIPEIDERVGFCVENIKNYKNVCNIIMSDWPGQFLIDEALEKGILNLENEIKKTLNNRHIISHILFLEGVNWDILGKVWLDLFSATESNNYIRDLVKLFSYIERLDIYIGKDKILGEIFKTILKYAILKDNINIELKIHPREFFGEGTNEIFTVKNLKTKKDEVREEIRFYFSVKEDPSWDKQKKEKFHEHISLWGLIKKLRRKLYKEKTGLKNRLFLILPCSILISDTGENKNIVEFDGGILEMKVKSGKAVMYVLEAKRGRTGNAEEELKNKLNTLGIGVPPIEKLSKKDAFAIWKLN